MMLDYKKLLESLLRELIDKKIISEWYCNGAGYFWKYNEKDKRIIKLEKENTELENKIDDIKANCDLAIEGRDIKIMELEQQIEKMKCCANCKSFKGYGETCEGWGEPVLNLNCDCTEWELKEIEK